MDGIDVTSPGEDMPHDHVGEREPALRQSFLLERVFDLLADVLVVL
jgi:hypothetical protein